MWQLLPLASAVELMITQVISPLCDILAAIFSWFSGSGVRIQEGYGIIILEGADYVLTRSRSKLQSRYTKWGIKRERERERGLRLYEWCLLVLVGGRGSRAFTAVWKLVLSGQQCIRVFCPTSQTNTSTWNPSFLGESRSVGLVHPRRPCLKNIDLTLCKVRALNVNETAGKQISGYF